MSYDPASASAVIDAEDQTAGVTVVNTFESASLVVVKTVIGAGVPQFSSGPFVFDVGCDFDGATDVFSATVTIAGSADGSTVESAPIDGLPVGATCTVTETDGPARERTSPRSPRRRRSQPTTSGTTVRVGFDNPFSAGTISVEKAVETSPGAGPRRRA